MHEAKYTSPRQKKGIQLCPLRGPGAGGLPCHRQTRHLSTSRAPGVATRVNLPSPPPPPPGIRPCLQTCVAVTLGEKWLPPASRSAGQRCCYPASPRQPQMLAVPHLDTLPQRTVQTCSQPLEGSTRDCWQSWRAGKLS